MNLQTEKKYLREGFKVVIGVDEAGRGPLAGPVVASAVIVNLASKNQSKNFQELLNKARDSKKLSPKQRDKIFELIKKTPEIQFAYSFVSEKNIDKINIEQATFLAMRKSIQKLEKKLNLKPDIILVDGNRKISQLNILQKTIIKGDDKIFSIALASIISKIMRDKKMIALSKKYPRYHFEIHKGYPTKLHLQLLKKYGPSEIHRKSFQPVQLMINNSKKQY